MMYNHWSAVAEDDWPWKNFSPQEMACKGTGGLLVVPEFMDMLQGLRDGFGEALFVTSGYRSPDYDAKIGGARVHPTGMAADVKIAGANAHFLLELASGLDFTGIGLRQHGDWEKRFVHLDTLPAHGAGHPRPRVWTYNVKE